MSALMLQHHSPDGLFSRDQAAGREYKNTTILVVGEISLILNNSSTCF